MSELRGTRALETWCRRITEGYSGVKIENMTTSWRDGLAFCAIIHHFRPELIDFSKLKKSDIYHNNNLAFRIAERHLGIPALLDAEDMVECEVPDRLSILTYLSQFYQTFGASSNQGSPTSRIAPKRSTVGTTDSPSTSPPTKMSTRSTSGVASIKREPCAKCTLPVFLAERLNVASKLYHRTCFRCARCNTQLSLANCYETEIDGQYCCETCPDEDQDDIDYSNIKPPVDVHNMILTFDRTRSLSDEEKQMRQDSNALVEPVDTEHITKEVTNNTQTSLVQSRLQLFESTSLTNDSNKNSNNINTTELSRESSLTTDLAPNALDNSRTALQTNKEVLDDYEYKKSLEDLPIVLDQDKSLETELPTVLSEMESLKKIAKTNSPDLPTVLDESTSNESFELDLSTGLNETESTKVADLDLPTVLDRRKSLEETLPIITRRKSTDTLPTGVEKGELLEEDLIISSDEGKLKIVQNEENTLLEKELLIVEDKAENIPAKIEENHSLLIVLDENTNDALLPTTLDERNVNNSSETKPTTFDDDSSVQKTLEMKVNDDYPDDLNPFADDEQIPVPVPRKNKSVEGDNKKVVVVVPRVSLNPFWSDDEEPSDLEEVAEQSTDTKPVPLPRTTKLTPQPSPKPRRSDLSINYSDRYDSNSSLSSWNSSIDTPRKKKQRAPLPPNLNSLASSTPSKPKKKSKAPLPPAISSHIDDFETEKSSKDTKNKNRQSLNLSPSSELVAVDKSVHGQWKRRKGPAPGRPVPQRRQIKPLPIAELRRELDMIELQQQGLEKQGVKLEQLIREKCETQDDCEDSLTSDVEELVLELFELVNEKNELFRRQAELMYLRRQQRLEEEYADLEYQIHCLMDQPEINKTDSDKAREEELINRLVEVVERRNEIVECLEMDRLREAEEDQSINARLSSLAIKRDEEECKQQHQEEDIVKLSKKEKKKMKKDKKLKEKGKGLDIDKDIDETEVNVVTTKLKEKKRKKWF